MITVGIDEVGRGAWAGPLVVGAVILSEEIDGLTDSKLLIKTDREILSVEIHRFALAVGTGWVEPDEIDRLGLSEALKLGCTRAIAKIKIAYDEIIIDGHINFLSNNPKSKALIKADQTVPAVSAASIVAKVARDKFMRQQALVHKSYGFEKHVGYGTELHIDSLKKLGICPIHRRSYKPVAAHL